MDSIPAPVRRADDCDVAQTLPRRRRIASGATLS
jgi:hypothetical protein